MRELKTLLRQIKIDRARGLTLHSAQWNQVQAYWLKMFGQPALTYPDVTIYNMIEDLENAVDTNPISG